MNYDVKDMGLAELGARRAEWASREMKVLESIKQRFVKERPLEGRYDRRLSARYFGNGQFGDHSEGRWRGGGNVRV